MRIVTNVRDVPGITDFDAEIYDSICYWYETGETAITPKHIWHGAMGYHIEPLDDEIKTVIESVEKMSETWVTVKGTTMNSHRFKVLFGKDISEVGELTTSGNLLNVTTVTKQVNGIEEVEFILYDNPILNDTFEE